MTAPVVRVGGFRKTYGRVVAVDEISFDVRDGEIFYPRIALSGLFFPIANLPPRLQAVSRVLPLTMRCRSCGASCAATRDRRILPISGRWRPCSWCAR